MDYCSGVGSVKADLSRSDNCLALGKMSPGILVKEVEPAATNIDVKTRQTQSQPLAAYSAAPVGQVDPIPLPELDQTLEKLKSLSAKMDGRWGQSNVANFERKLGVFESQFASGLQRALENDALTDVGWFGPYWDEMYLKLRVATPINVSFGLELNKPAAFSGQQRFFQSMAGAVLGAYEHLQIIQEGKLAVERDGRDKPLCMKQPKRLFCHRKAMTGKDQLVPCPQGKAQHIIVLSKGQIYRIQVADQSGKRISQCDLAETLGKLSKENAKEGVLDLTAMTAVNRDECALLQAKFSAGSENNKVLMDQVEKAFLCVCLDDCEGIKEEGISRQLLVGNGCNRCFDKNLQLIRLANGGIGATIEHTPADAGVLFPLFHRINNALESGQLLHGALLPEYTLLTPKVDDCLEKDLAKASEHFQAEFGQVELEDITIRGVTEAALRAPKRFSPDAFYQLVFQLAAYYAGYENPPTYESASMREYKNGRTDDLRSFSPEVVEFLAAVSNDLSGEVKAERLIKALEAHKQKIKDCKAGKGICRHLFALEKKWVMCQSC